MRTTLFRGLLLLLLLTLGGAARAQTPTTSTDYILGAGDVIRVTVFQSPELSLDTRIPESGVVSYSLLGAVTLGGLTITQAERRLADGLLAGAVGIVPVCANYEPDTFLRACQAAAAGARLSWRAAKSASCSSRRKLPLMGANWIAGVKYGVASLGIGSGRPVSPLHR